MTFGHVCCGGGGDILGVQMAGHRSLWAFDLNQNCVNTVAANFPGLNIQRRDIRKLTEELEPPAGVICGIPCQPFSKMGRRLKENDPRDISERLLCLLEKLKSSFILFENVREYRGSTGYRLLLNGLSKSYSLQEKVLNVADYGVPQRRNRLIIAGSRGGLKYKFPEATHCRRSTLFDQRPEWKRFKTIRCGNGTRPMSSTCLKGIVRRQLKHARKGNNFSFQIIDDEDMCFTVMGRMYKGSGSQFYAIYEKGMLRDLSMIEAMRAQSFPDSYIFCGPVAEKWKMIGDAVPSLFVASLLSRIAWKPE